MPPLVAPVTASVGTPSLIIATAPYATPVLNGNALAAPAQPPNTSMWFLLYAQAVQADGALMRNVLIASEAGISVNRRLDTIDPGLKPYWWQAR